MKYMRSGNNPNQIGNGLVEWGNQMRCVASRKAG